MVLLSFPAANRDPEMFPDPDRVIIGFTTLQSNHSR
jgi:cytochrome P450